MSSLLSEGGDDKVGNPHRAQIAQFELFELILVLKLDKPLSIEQFEPTVSQSTVPSPPLSLVWVEGLNGSARTSAIFSRPRKGGSKKGDPEKWLLESGV